MSSDLRELWEHRGLLYFLVWRDLKVRYKQTVLGIAWAVLQPVLAMLVFSLFFGRLAKIGADGFPYPVFNLAGLIAWNFFASGVTEAANSLVASRQLLTKVYFPRVTIPLAGIIGALADLASGLVLVAVVMAWYGMAPAPQAVMVLPLVCVAFAAASGAGVWLAALNVRYRDVRYVLPFLMQLWLFATPVVYPTSVVPAAWRQVYALNPMVGVVDGFRWALLGAAWPGATIAVSTASALVLVVLGASYFRRMERGFADVV